MKTFLFHGISGCGKDTQVDLLVERFGFLKIATGDMFRDLFEAGEPLGIEAHDFMKEGILVPDDLVYKILEVGLAKYDTTKDWAFVSVVRNRTQLPLFDALLQKYNRPLNAFVHLILSEQAAIERMSFRSYCPKCNAIYHSKSKPEKVAGICDVDGTPLLHRDDDKPEAIKKRFEWYNDDIKPILDTYRARNLLVEIDASPSIEVIHQEIISKLLIV